MNSESHLPESLILDATGASAVVSAESIQSLWSGNGSIIRVLLGGSVYNSVIVKCIRPNSENFHPRGWNTQASFSRKLKSYAVETNWYRQFASLCSPDCAVPKYLADYCVGHNRWLVLEDLAHSFPARHEKLSVKESRACIHWLAHFHGQFIGNTGDGLWPIGSYWHLETRQDEYASMEEGELKDAAYALDDCLNHCQFQTLVHGDAKVANFCFSECGERVAAVDFQYVGRGCGIKDVIYFFGSIMNEEECALYSEKMLDEYFAVLSQCLPYEIVKSVIQEWRSLYPIAWADFHRFLAGWMPEHHKIHGYTQTMTNQALKKLSQGKLSRGC